MNGRTPESVRVQLFRLYRKLNLKAPPFNEHSEVDNERLNLLNGKTRTPRTPEAKEPRPTPEQSPRQATEKKKSKSFKFSWKWDRQYLLDIINIGEMLMVLIGCCMKFGYVGLIPGLMCVSLYVHTALEMRNGKSKFARDAGMFVCLVLSLAVFNWLHGQTFHEWLPVHTDHRTHVAFGSAALISLMSVVALWQTRNVQED